jgi:hypothetical protein
MTYVWWWLIVLVWLPLGCSHPPPFADPIKAINEHPRIVYQSLLPSEPVVEQCPPLAPIDSTSRVATDSEPVGPKSSVPVAMSVPFTKPLFVAFQKEEWHIPPDHADWSAVIQQLDPLAHYLIVGYSHGVGEQEQALLAQRRAEYIASLLHKAGFPLNQIHRMASWSAQREPFAPSLGAQIFLLSPEATEIRLGVAHKGETSS